MPNKNVNFDAVYASPLAQLQVDSSIGATLNITQGTVGTTMSANSAIIGNTGTRR